MYTVQRQLGVMLLNEGEVVEVPTWQAKDVRGTPQGSTFEILNPVAICHIPSNSSRVELASAVQPNLPWADNHFEERVSGKPLNPGETYKEWPWYQGNVEEHKKSVGLKPTGFKRVEMFSHTYMERYWPSDSNPLGADGERRGYPSNSSQFGDLNDVIKLLEREPTTRQAYLPVWFPFDTGAVHKERVPCSLGYLFLMRKNQLDVTYYIRSCDLFRHFKDDVYLTCRLCMWVLDELRARDSKWQEVKPGRLTMHMGSLHIFEAELPRLRREYGDGN